jgi:hypothetical protein
METINESRWNAVDWIVAALVIIGGINWGLVGAFNFNLVETLLGGNGSVASIIYVLVGLSALYMIYSAMKAGSRIHLTRTV